MPLQSAIFAMAVLSVCVCLSYTFDICVNTPCSKKNCASFNYAVSDQL